MIKRITQHLSPRVCRIAALPVPTQREKTQWFFQHYVADLLGMIPYDDLTKEKIVLPKRTDLQGYVRPPITDQAFVPQIYP